MDCQWNNQIINERIIKSMDKFWAEVIYNLYKKTVGINQNQGNEKWFYKVYIRCR